MMDENKKLLERMVSRGRSLRLSKTGAGGQPKINTRVFNCFRITKHAMQQDQTFRPLFHTASMNLCIVSKEVVPSHMKNVLRPHQLATKVHFPFADEYVVKENKRIGGKYLYVGEANFEKKLNDHFLGSQPEKVREHDLGVLKLFDSIPSLDPFLIRDKFEINDLEIDEMYLQIPVEEWQAIKKNIISKFRPLARIAFQDASSTDEQLEVATLKLVEKMWEALDVDTLKPLTMALRIETDDVGALYYAWKGIVYYDYKIGNMLPDLNKLMAALNKFANDRSANTYNGSVIPDWKIPMARIQANRKDLNSVLSRYHKVYDDFFVKGQNPTEFHLFFQIAEELFWFLGSTVSILDSCIEQYLKLNERAQYTHEAVVNLWCDLVELTITE